MYKMYKKILLYSTHLLLGSSTIFGSCSNFAPKHKSDLSVTVKQDSVEIYHTQAGKTSENFIQLFFDSDKINDTKDVSFKCIGDNDFADKLIVNNDFSVGWTDDITKGTYVVKWQINYKNLEVFTPNIYFLVLSNDPILIEPGNIDNEFWFTEHFFDFKSNIYNESLASASVAATLSFDTCVSGDLSTNGDLYIKNLMVDRLHFDDYEVMGYNEPTTTQSIGASIGRKTFPANYFNDGYNDETTLIFMPVRSSSYFHEWADNVFVGNGDETRTVTGLDGKQYTFKTLYQNHSGFNLSAQVVINFLRLYIEKYQIVGRIKLWLDGFSRGAAVTNNIAGILDRAIYENNLSSFLGEGSYNLDKYDIYAYTFATPMGVNKSQDIDPRSSVYDNIFNLIDLNDIVTKIAPEAWGFTRYGIDFFQGSRLCDPNFNSNFEKRQKQMKNKKIYDDVLNFMVYKMNGELNPTEFVNISPQFAWDSLIAAVTQQIVNRNVYVENWQSDVMEIVDGIMNNGTDITDYWTQLISKLFSLNNCTLYPWISTLAHNPGVIMSAHDWDNYCSYCKATSVLYFSSEEDEITYFKEWSYCSVYSRCFNYVVLMDTNLNKVVFATLDNKPTINTQQEIPYSIQVEACVYDYSFYPYYTEGRFPNGKYKLGYKADLYAVWTDAYVMVCRFSSDKYRDVIFEQHYTIYFSTDLYIVDLDLI